MQRVCKSMKSWFKFQRLQFLLRFKSLSQSDLFELGSFCWCWIWFNAKVEWEVEKQRFSCVHEIIYLTTKGLMDGSWKEGIATMWSVEWQSQISTPSRSPSGWRVLRGWRVLSGQITPSGWRSPNGLSSPSGHEFPQWVFVQPVGVSSSKWAWVHPVGVSSPRGLGFAQWACVCQVGVSSPSWC